MLETVRAPNRARRGTKAFSVLDEVNWSQASVINPGDQVGGNPPTENRSSTEKWDTEPRCLDSKNDIIFLDIT